MTEKYEVTEQDFNAAVNNAPYWARKRLFKKLEKRIYRGGQARPPKDLEQWVTNFVLTYRGDNAQG